MAASTFSNLSVVIAHTVSFLTHPLIKSYPSTTVAKLQLVLEANLSALYAPSWVTNEPLRSSGRRCLTLSPNCLPPRAIYAACIASGVQWFDWISLLGGREFDLFVDPGCVSVRFGQKGTPDSQVITVWADGLSSIVPKADSVAYAESSAVKVRNVGQSKSQRTLAQQLLEEDKEEDEQLFAMIADEVNGPTWMTSILDQFPRPARTSSPLSVHSRSSSRSSNSSTGFSVNSGASFSSMSTFSSTSGSKSVSGKEAPKLSRRERARQARVFVDSTKTDVTPYDGGKTTVLTGGVMLGGGPSKAQKTSRPLSMAGSNNWRNTRS